MPELGEWPHSDAQRAPTPYDGWENDASGANRRCPNCGALPERQNDLHGKFLRWFYPNCLTYDIELEAYFYECARTESEKTMAKAFTRQQRFARRLDDIHAEFVTESGCGFEAFQQDYRGGSTGELTDAAQEIYQAALAAAPTHVPPPRTAFLEQCEVEIYEGLTYVRLDDVMQLLSTYVPEDAPRRAPDHPFIDKYVCRGVHKCSEPKEAHLPRREWRVWLKDEDGAETEISPFRVLEVPHIHLVWRRKDAQ